METLTLFLKVLWAPRETMFLISQQPRVLVPLLLLSLFSMASGIIVVTKVDQGEMAIRTLERTAGIQLPDDLRDRTKAQASNATTLTISIVSSAILPVVRILIVTAIYFGLFTILGRVGSFKAFFALTAFAFAPLIFSQLAAMLTVLVVPETSILPDELGAISPAIFLDRGSVPGGLFAAVNMIDLVSLWILVLLTTGFGFLIRRNVSSRTRTAAVFVPFLVYAGLRIGLAYLQGF